MPLKQLGKNPCRKPFTKKKIEGGKNKIEKDPKSFTSLIFLSHFCAFISKGISKMLLNKLEKNSGRKHFTHKIKGGGL
jgi:hypothetical protein